MSGLFPIRAFARTIQITLNVPNLVSTNRATLDQSNRSKAFSSYTIEIPDTTTIDSLKELIAQKTGMRKSDIILTIQKRDLVHSSYNDPAPRIKNRAQLDVRPHPTQAKQTQDILAALRSGFEDWSSHSIPTSSVPNYEVLNANSLPKDLEAEVEKLKPVIKDMKLCPACQEPLAYRCLIGQSIVQLNCPGKHILCKGCLEEAHQHNREKLKECMICRGELLPLGQSHPEVSQNSATKKTEVSALDQNHPEDSQNSAAKKTETSEPSSSDADSDGSGPETASAAH